jgi:TPR repeat protein
VLLSTAIWINLGDAAPVSDSNPVLVRDLARAKQLQRGGEFKSAALLLHRHANSQSAEASYRYAQLLVRGWGIDRDLEAARDLLLTAVQTDFSNRGQSALELGRLYRKSRGDDCQRIALEWFQKSLDWGHTKAHAELGKSFARGLGTPSNFDRAYHHYSQAVLAGSTSAVFSLVNLVRNGTADREGHPAQAKILIQEYLPAVMRQAKAGDAQAARALGRIYQEGLLLSQNTGDAVHWFGQAVRMGDAAAMHDLAMLATTEPVDGLNQEAIVGLLNESADRGYAGAMTALGRLHLAQWQGLDPALALGWFERGVAAGHGGSMEELARLFLVGQLVSKDLTKAEKLAAHGAKLKHSGSVRLLEKMRSGRGSADASSLEQSNQSSG